MGDGGATNGALPDWQALYEDAACGLLLTGVDGTIRRVNRTFCRWIGMTPEELCGRRRMQDLLTMGGRIFHQTHWAPLLQMQGSVAEVKVDVVHRDGSSVPMMMNAIRRAHAGSELHELSLFVATDRSRYEAELLLARRRAEELLRQQQEVQRALTESQAELDRQRSRAEDRALFAEQMIGIVSHDLRNPLSAIQLSAFLLAHAELAGAERKAVDRITTSTGRAQRLIEDLLDFTAARVGSGLSVTLESIDLHQLVAAAAEELRSSFAGRDIEHRRVGSGTCRGDADRLAQALGNLVANAMTYGAFDRPVRLTSRIESETFSIEVHNEGRPIPGEQLAGLFAPMTRGLAAVNSARSVGLGLFIVREIARAHGGEVGVTSSAQEGTLFSVRCPR
jgi:sigma-B regulation protein RsbU (phosphoserine phosphatase)